MASTTLSTRNRTLARSPPSSVLPNAFTAAVIITILTLARSSVFAPSPHTVASATAVAVGTAAFAPNRRCFLRRRVAVAAVGMSSSPSSSPANGDSERTTKAPTRWSDPTNDAVARCVPPMSSSNYKGSSGRVGVLGGSKRYTGAPYYAAMASLKVGADLAFVFCAEEAAVPIKCYSPELMVAPVYSAAAFDTAVALADEEEKTRLFEGMVSEVTALFNRMHVLVVGPGLGRCPLVLRATARIIELARKANLPLVIDADALFLLTQEPYRDLVSGYRGAVLTPNAMEFERLVQAMKGDGCSNGAGLKADESQRPNLTGFELATTGNVIVRKGHHDILSSTFVTIVGEDASDALIAVVRKGMVCEEEGGLKRSGGIGDILAGTLGTFVAWNHLLSARSAKGGVEGIGKNSKPDDDIILACWSACCVIKQTTRVAFEKKRRAMTAPDVLDELGSVVNKMTSVEKKTLRQVDNSSLID